MRETFAHARILGAPRAGAYFAILMTFHTRSFCVPAGLIKPAKMCLFIRVLLIGSSRLSCTQAQLITTRD